MARTTSKGKCSFCGEVFAKAAIGRHLAGCAARQAAESADPTAPATPRLHLVVEGRGMPMYWMHLAMPTTTTLTALDHFLRDQWLECCGHLSAFRIGGASYASSVDRSWGMDDRAMGRVKLADVVGEGAKFGYEYDFGSTTELTLRVLGAAGSAAKSRAIQILAQNEPPPIACDECGQPATQLCTQCMDADTGRFCDQHAKAHRCDEEMFLPVVNSPRCGVCGYEG